LGTRLCRVADVERVPVSPFLALLLAADLTRPSLVLRASPRISIANPGVGCSQVLFVAEIRGPEVEAWYCPRVEWQWPDGTVSAEESDCPPFDVRWECQPARGPECTLDWHTDPLGGRVIDRNPCECTIPGFPRRWTRQVCVPPHPRGEEWEIGVRLSARGKTISTQRARVTVK